MGNCINQVNPSSNTKNNENNNNNNPSPKKSRFCVCEIPDGTDSFICTNCHLIKKRARDKAAEMKNIRNKMKEKKNNKQKLLSQSDSNNPFDSDSSDDNSDDSSNDDDDDDDSRKEDESKEEMSNVNILERVKVIMDYKTYQELALKKVFNDFDADNNNYLDAMEFRMMTCEYEDGTEIYQSITQEEAEKYIELVDITGDELLDENQFVEYMMECLETNLHTQCKKYGGGIHTLQIFTKIRQFVDRILSRLNRRAAFLYQLFTTYSTSRYVKKRHVWVKDVMGTTEVFKMMSEIADSDSKKPTEDDVLLFLRSVDKNGDMLLQRDEFMVYMLNGLTKSRDDLQQFMRKSKVNNRIAYFLREVDKQVKTMDKSMTLDDVNMEIVMQEIQNVLLFNRTINTDNLEDSTPSQTTIFNKHNGGTYNNNKNYVEGGENDNTINRSLSNTEDIIRIFKPKVLQKAAEHIKDDELTRSALLNIVSEELRTNGLTNTPEQSAALQDLLLASENGTGSRRVRLSGSKRNLTRVKEEFQDEQKRLENEMELVRTKQRAQTRKKLERRRSMRLEKLGSKIMPIKANSFEMHTFLVSPEKANHRRKGLTTKIAVMPMQDNPNDANDIVPNLMNCNNGNLEKDFSIF